MVRHEEGQPAVPKVFLIRPEQRGLITVTMKKQGRQTEANSVGVPILIQHRFCDGKAKNEKLTIATYSSSATATSASHASHTRTSNS